MNLFDQARSKASPLKHYEREFMCSVEGVLLPNEAFDYDLGQRDFMCRECRAREVEDDRKQAKEDT
jgi:hypothetical protein